MTRPALSRLLRIHGAIASGAYPSLDELADLCEAHPRTVKRDLRLLRDDFEAPLSYSQQHGGYHYTRPFSFVPPPFHEQELLALCVAIDVAHSFQNTPFADAVRSALEKLRLMMPSPSQLAYDEGSAVIAYVPDPALPERTQTAVHFNQLLDAINAHRQVRLAYHSLSAEEDTQRVVDPYQLYLHHGVWYLHGFCHLRNQGRDFAVHRILSLELLAATFLPPDPNLLRQAMARRFTIIEATPADVRIRFDAETAPFIKERVWHHTQQITDHADGSCTLEMHVDGLSSVQRWALSFGRHAVPLAPAALVAQVRAEAEALARACDEEARKARTHRRRRGG